MNFKFIVSFLIFNIFNKILPLCEILLPELTVCQDISVLLGSEKNLAKIIDVEEGASVKLYCSYCSVDIENGPKHWYFKKRGLHIPKESFLETDFDILNISITSDHVLKITHFNSSANSGTYTCEVSKTDDQAIFTYVLEGVYSTINNDVPSSIGSFNEWIHYKEEQLDPMNEQFENPKQEPFITFQNVYNFSFRVKTYWEKWGKCELFNGFKGIRKRPGKCRLKVVPNYKIEKTEVTLAPEVEIINNLFKNESYDVFCRSVQLNEILPEISKFVRYIPDYDARELCDVDRKMLLMPLFNTEEKLTTTKRIPENGHGVLICPEDVLGSKVEWFKDGKLLNSSYRYNIAKNKEEPRLTIDSYNSLFVFHATKKEEGSYTCVIDGIKMYKYDIRVFKKSGLLNYDFFRYSIYLGFVLLLATICYCAGICVAWHEKSSFSDPLNLNIQQLNTYQN